MTNSSELLDRNSCRGRRRFAEGLLLKPSQNYLTVVCVTLSTEYFYLTRRLTQSATMKKDSREVRKVWKGIVVAEGGDWCPLLVCASDSVGVGGFVCVFFSVSCPGLYSTVGSVRHNLFVVPLKSKVTSDNLSSF